MYIVSNQARNKLVQSTQQLLWDRGYAATSPAAIMKDAGVGQGSMYHHFTGKTELAAEAFRLSAEATFVTAQDLLESESSGLERVIDYLLRRRDVLRGCPVGRMAEDADVLALPELFAILQSTFARLRTLVVKNISVEISAGTLPAEFDAEDLADTVLAVVQGGYIVARAENDPMPFERAVRGAVALLRVASGRLGAATMQTTNAPTTAKA